MIQKNQIKFNIKNKKDNEIINRRRQNFKNIYTQIKKNQKTSFSQTKHKNKLYIATSKKLNENLTKKSGKNDIYIPNNKKFEESRNDNKTNSAKNNDDELYDGENGIFFNKTEKDIKLLYNKNYSKKSLKKNYIKQNINDKILDNEKDVFIKKSNYNSNISKKEIKEDGKNIIQNNFLFQNQKINSNKEYNQINENSKNKNTDNNELKKKENSFEKKPKLIINKKIFTKEDFIKSKNLFEKLNSARFSNNGNHKLNLNLNKEIKSEIKTISNKNTSRISSQKLVDLKEKELNLGKIKKIKKNKIFKQITKFGKKNHSMTMNDTNKILLLNDTIKNEKEKEKFSKVNIYNYPNIRNNIPRHKNFIADSAEKENSECTIKNNLSNLNSTCFYFNDMNINNSTLNNNLNGTLNPKENRKKTPNKYHYHNNSFNNLYNQMNFYSKPVARLKKKIFDSPSDKINSNSINEKSQNHYLNKSDFQEKDSLDVNIKDKNNNFIKELLIAIKTLNQIIIHRKK